jgi:hypothetical protein
VGGPDTVERGLASLVRQTGADELMITAQCYDHQARLRSFEIAADMRERLGSASTDAAATYA